MCNILKCTSTLILQAGLVLNNFNLTYPIIKIKIEFDNKIDGWMGQDISVQLTLNTMNFHNKWKI